MGTTQFLGEEGFRWFIGIVEDVNDEKKLGRVKVRVFNLDEDVKTDDLNWAQVMMPTTSASFEGFGDTPQLSVGSRVIGFFIDGKEKQIPMIIGSFPIMPKDTTKHSIPALARGQQTIGKEKAHPVEPDSAYAAEYPFNRVIQTRAGHAIELDDTPGQERIHIFHKSGTSIEINAGGRMVIKSVGDSFDIVGGAKKIAIKGDCNLSVDGTLSAIVKSDVSINTEGNIKLSAGGRLSLNAENGISLNSGTDVTVAAPGGLNTTIGGIRSVTHVTPGDGKNDAIVVGGRSFIFESGILTEST